MRLDLPGSPELDAADIKNRLRETDRRTATATRDLGSRIAYLGATAKHEWVSGPYTMAPSTTYTNIGSWGNAVDDGLVTYDGTFNFYLNSPGKWFVGFQAAGSSGVIGTVSLSMTHPSFFGSSGRLRSTGFVGGISETPVSWTSPLSVEDTAEPFSFYTWWSHHDTTDNRTFNWRVTFNYLGGLGGA